MKDSFHVRYQAKPELVRATFEVLATRKPAGSSELGEALEGLGYKTGTLDEQLSRLRKLGLINNNNLQLTKRGEACAEILRKQPALFFDLLHYYHFTLWNESQPDVNRFSWTYQTVCKHLWELGSAAVDNRVLLERVMEETLNQFPYESNVSLSSGTIRGVLDWLRRLQPPVYDGKHFKRRAFGPPELALLGMDFLYTSQGVEYGELLALDDAAFKKVAVLCMVDDGVLDAMLKECTRRFSWFEIQAGWGYYVRLHQSPNLTEDI